MSSRLRVAIDCRIADPQQGVGTALIVLAKALSDSNEENHEYVFVIRESMQGWLKPWIYGPCRLEVVPDSKLTRLKAAFQWIAPLRLIWRKLRWETTQVPVSDGYVESGQFDIVHFPTQVAYLTELPTIYQPHDLQHLHYPQFFPKAQFALREREYRTFCDQAKFVCVQTEWTKRDVIAHYGLPQEKVVVIPWGPSFEAYSGPSAEEVLTTISKFGLPSTFFFYPAVTWPHKNHEIIFRALRHLRSDFGLSPHVVFTGAFNSYRSTLDDVARELGVSKQLHFLGFVSTIELQSIYKAATAMIYPSRFEGFGLPILEAFHSRLPVLASNTTTLPEVASDGALYFDPDSAVEVGRLMKTMLERTDIREDLIRKGTRVLAEYSIARTAESFKRLYKRTLEESSRAQE
jgi:glycosyltransferase involved in cell wall biosynthesis